MDSPTSNLPIRIAQTVGITVSSILSGSTLSLSLFLIPRILESPTPLILRQWVNMYNIGKKSGPPISMVAAFAYFYLAHALPASNKAAFYRYVAAGILSVGIAPYTFAFMLKTNGKLLNKVEETKSLSVMDKVVEVGLGEETAHELVDWWGVLNLGRGFMLAAAGILGAWTALE